MEQLAGRTCGLLLRGCQSRAASRAGRVCEGHDCDAASLLAQLVVCADGLLGDIPDHCLTFSIQSFKVLMKCFAFQVQVLDLITLTCLYVLKLYLCALGLVL